MKALFYIVFAFLLFSSIHVAAQAPSPDSKIYGLLIGSAIGDAAGGPVEFVDPPARSYWCTTDEVISSDGIDDLAARFKMMPYPKTAEPYAQFEPFAKPGTVTDDTRWKMILFNSLRHFGNYQARSMAQSYWNFPATIYPKYDSICSIWQEEYGFVMNHYLGKEPNFPPDRIWGGIPTMAGQMPYLPVAALFPGDPESAYRAAFENNILDVGYAKDITAALVAGLSEALRPQASWEEVFSSMRTTDPYNFANVPWVPRKTNAWMDKADELVLRSNGVISDLFLLLESELNAVTWWEAHVPLCVSIAFLKIVDYNPHAALQLCMEFGHDNDSYAQVVGAFVGAMYGSEAFDEQMIALVNTQMRAQYHQDTNDWMEVIIQNK